MKSEVFCSEKLGTLTGEYEQVWICARRKNVFGMSGKTDDPATEDSLEVRLEEARAEHARLQTSSADFEQK